MAKRKLYFQHHIRLRLALNLEFQEDGRAESETVWVTDQVLQLSDLLAALITGLLVWIGSDLPAYWAGWAWRIHFARLRFTAWLGEWRRDLALIARAAVSTGWRDLCCGWAEDLPVIAEAGRLMFAGNRSDGQLIKVG